MITALINPWFYESLDLDNYYSVLYEESVRTPISNVLIITSLLSCLLRIIPMFFYNINDKKMAEIINELKARADAE